jgi:hypothetical protein
MSLERGGGQEGDLCERVDARGGEKEKGEGGAREKGSRGSAGGEKR